MRQKPHRLQSLVSWLKSRLRGRRMLKWAFRLINIVNLVARFLDWLQ